MTKKNSTLGDSNSQYGIMPPAPSGSLATSVRQLQWYRRAMDEAALRRKAEAALRDSEERFRRMAGEIREVYYVLSGDGQKLIYVSPSCESIWGRSSRDLCKDPRRWYEAIHPEDRKRVMEYRFWKVERGQPGEEFRIVRPDGSVRWVLNRSTPVRDQAGRITEIVGCAEDITARKRSEEARLELESIVERLDDAVIRIKLDGVITGWSSGAERIFGYPRAEAEGRPITMIVPQGVFMEFRRTVLELKQKNRALRYELTHVGKRGAKIHVALSMSPVCDLEGRVTGASVIAKDVTERKQLERELLEFIGWEQRRIGQDLHDSLGQHLLGIASLVKGLEQKLADRSAEEQVDAARIASLVSNTIPEIRKLASGLYAAELEQNGLMPALRQLCNDVSRMTGTDCRFECKTPFYLDDQTAAIQLYRISQEALNNAIRHGKAAGIALTVRYGRDRITLSIQDNGTGFPDTAEKEPGMGLKIMRYRAGMIGARLKIERVPQGGTLVTCVLPFTKKG